MSGKIKSVQYKLVLGEKSAAAFEAMKAEYGLTDDELVEAALSLMHSLTAIVDNPEDKVLVMTREGEAPVPLRISEFFGPKPRLVT